jgi:ribonuclease PH
MEKLVQMGVISKIPFKSAVAATSVGIVNSYMMIDLCYDEDSQAGVDFNIVMTSKGEFVELQGTAEGKPFTKQSVDDLVALAERGIQQLFKVQQEALKGQK